MRVSARFGDAPPIMLRYGTRRNAMRPTWGRRLRQWAWPASCCHGFRGPCRRGMNMPLLNLKRAGDRDPGRKERPNELLLACHERIRSFSRLALEIVDAVAPS